MSNVSLKPVHHSLIPVLMQHRSARCPALPFQATRDPDENTTSLRSRWVPQGIPVVCHRDPGVLTQTMRVGVV